MQEDNNKGYFILFCQWIWVWQKCGHFGKKNGSKTIFFLSISYSLTKENIHCSIQLIAPVHHCSHSRQLHIPEFIGHILVLLRLSMCLCYKSGPNLAQPVKASITVKAKTLWTRFQAIIHMQLSWAKLDCYDKNQAFNRELPFCTQCGDISLKVSPFEFLISLSWSHEVLYKLIV